jgi:hypothetical protein
MTPIKRWFVTKDQGEAILAAIGKQEARADQPKVVMAFRGDDGLWVERSLWDTVQA